MERSLTVQFLYWLSNFVRKKFPYLTRGLTKYEWESHVAYAAYLSLEAYDPDKSDASLETYVKVCVELRIRDVVREFNNTIKHRPPTVSKNYKEATVKLIEQASKVKNVGTSYSKIEKGEVDNLDPSEVLNIREAVSHLPKRMREVIIKRFWEGKSQQETADEMNVTVDAITSASHRSFKKLREVLC